MQGRGAEMKIAVLSPVLDNTKNKKKVNPLVLFNLTVNVVQDQLVIKYNALILSEFLGRVI